MQYVNVLIDLPVRQLDQCYSYSVPEVLADEAQFGKRVLVELGNRKVEGFITAVASMADENCALSIKSIIKVLDSEPVFDKKLYELAEWMAEHYLCPLSVALKAMIPRMLNQKRGIKVFPVVSKTEAETLPENVLGESNQAFFDLLWDKGELSLYETRKHLSNEAIQEMAAKGLIFMGGSYSGYRNSKEGYGYILKDIDWERDLPRLEKKAPRQAEAIRMLLQLGEVESRVLDKMLSAQSIKSLLKKGYIELVKNNSMLSANIHTLNHEQQTALQVLEEAISRNKKEQFLLYGVTGSGKTEVYLRAAQKCIEQGKQVIILVPEIALTRHLVEVFTQRMSNVAVLHSSMPMGERYDEWKRIRRGEAEIVLGTRSAIFAPLPRIGLIVIDEEQENTYKQEETPKYHVHEVALKRAEMEAAVLVFGSATPSIETFHRALKGELKLLRLNQRVGNARMPSILVENMRRTSKYKDSQIISPLLGEKLTRTMERGEQSILFIHRRGYSPLTICIECGMIASCPHCSVGMTYHQDIAKNVCHYCNYQAKIPVNCPVCGSKHIKLLGLGSQRVEEDIRNLFPQARVERLDLDSSRKKGVQKNILARMKDREIDILIGTQMVTKGLDFPNVSLVGIVDADSILNLPDFRAGERCFQLMVQAAGRAGRGDLPGEVVIQSFNPDHPILHMAKNQDFRGFYNKEVRLRRLLSYPPFTNILRIVVISEQEELVVQAAQSLGEQLNDIIDAKEEKIEILGPAPCPINKIKKNIRWQLIIKCDNLILLKSIARYIIDRIRFKDVRLDMDINPFITM